MAAGAKAEAVYPALVEEDAASVRELEKLTEKHHSRYAPLGDKLRSARDAINAAADARRMLVATAGQESQQAATADIDQKILDLQTERDALRKRIADRRGWLDTIIDRGDTAASSDLQRLGPAKAELGAMLQEDAAIGVRFDTLQDERTRATAALLKPESI